MPSHSVTRRTRSYEHLGSGFFIIQPVADRLPEIHRTARETPGIPAASTPPGGRRSQQVKRNQRTFQAMFDNKLHLSHLKSNLP